jgi:hypothetical protein
MTQSVLPVSEALTWLACEVTAYGKKGACVRHCGLAEALTWVTLHVWITFRLQKCVKRRDSRREGFRGAQE